MEERPGIERRSQGYCAVGSKKTQVKESQEQAAEKKGEEVEPSAALGLADLITGPAVVSTWLQIYLHRLLPKEQHTDKRSSL